MIKQFIVYLMNLGGVMEHRVNCSNAESAKFITEGIYPNHRVIDIVEV